MANSVQNIYSIVASVNGSQANGEPVYVGGNLFTVQLDAPASLGRIETSNDKLTWAASSTGLGDSMTQNTIRPLWMRGAVASDGSGPRNFFFWITVYKEV